MYVTDWYTFLCTLSLVFHNGYTKEDICNHSKNTLEKVSTCPGNDTAFKMRSERKACHSYPTCQDKQLVYHCTRYEEGLVEVCAPRSNITGKCCTYFERGLGKVMEDNTKNCSECPFKYNSDESSKFSECVEPVKTTHSDQTLTRSTYNSTKRNSISTTPEAHTTFIKRQQDNNSSPSIPLIISISVLATIVLVTICGGYIIFRKRNEKHYLSCIPSKDIANVI